MFNLVRYFSYTSAMALFLTMALLIWLFRTDQIGEHLELAEKDSLKFSESFKNSYWPQFSRFINITAPTLSRQLKNRGEVRALAIAVKMQSDSLKLSKIVIYNRRGQIIYSTDAEQIGFNAGHEPTALSAIEQHLPVTNLSKEKTPHKEHYLAETYVPVFSPQGAPEGVIETYVDISDTVERVNRQSVKLALVLVGIFGTLYLVLIGVIGRADSLIKDQQADLVASTERLKQSEDRFSLSQRFANIGTWDWNIQTGDLYWSERIAPLFGHHGGLNDISYETFLAAVHEDDRQRVVDAIDASVNHGRTYEIEHRVVWPDGTVRWMLERGDVIRDDHGVPLQMLGVVQDITQRKMLEEKLLHLAASDSLTGALNHRSFMNAFESELNRAQRYGHSLSVLLCDIDYFKQVNDTFGHAAGDEALIAFADIMKGQIRKVDVLGRLGGEEFAIFMPETERDQALVSAERIRKAVHALELSTPKGPLSFTVSFGVATSLPDDDTREDILKRADDALYRAKESGRNKVIEA